MTILFLCTGNYYRSRYAQAYFNHLARQRNLPWRAVSRGLAVDRSTGNVGPIARAVIERLAGTRIDSDDSSRFPVQVTPSELAAADLVIALKEPEHRPLMIERFPDWTGRVEYWLVHDIDAAPVHEALAEIERNVEALVADLSRDRSASCTSAPRGGLTP